jgi:E3 ubiquitin-protein ligase RNF31
LKNSSQFDFQNERNDRIGPKPPPPPIPGENGFPKKITPDPDYEVIEFSSQQYSNAPPRLPQKNPGKDL